MTVSEGGTQVASLCKTLSNLRLVRFRRATCRHLGQDRGRQEPLFDEGRDPPGGSAKPHIHKGFEFGYLSRPCTHKSRLLSSGWSLSVLPPKADIRQRIEHVCFVPKSGRSSEGAHRTAFAQQPKKAHFL